MIVDNAQTFEMGRVISRTFGVFQRNAVTFLALAALLMAPMLLATIYSAANVTPGPSSQLYVMVVVSGVLGMICAYVLQASLVEGTVADLNGQRAGFSQCLSTGIRNVVPIIIIAILAYLGMALGIILLIVPGIMLAVSWAVVMPVRVIEQTSIGESFGRSRDLTKGFRWRIFWLLLIYVVLSSALQFGLRPLFGVAMLAQSVSALGYPYLLLSWAVNVVLSSVLAVGVASTYYELRLVKEGIGAQQLAAAFD